MASKLRKKRRQKAIQQKKKEIRHQNKPLVKAYKLASRVALLSRKARMCNLYILPGSLPNTFAIISKGAPDKIIKESFLFEIENVIDKYYSIRVFS